MKRRYTKGLGLLLTGILFGVGLAGCGKEAEPVYVGQSLASDKEVQEPEATDKYRTFYEIFVYSFWDSDGDICKFASGLYKANTYGDYITRGDERYAAQSEHFINAPFYSNHDMDRAAGYYTGEWAE